MNRRKFILDVTAGASVLALPLGAIASGSERLGSAKCLHRKATRIRVGLHRTEELRLRYQRECQLGRDELLSILHDDENNYWAEAITLGDKYYYRARGATVEITGFEFDHVIANPTLYYFSTALKLHARINRAIDGLYDD